MISVMMQLGTCLFVVYLFFYYTLFIKISSESFFLIFANRESISKAKVEVFGNYVTVISPCWAVRSWQAQQLQSPLEYPADLQIHKNSSRTPYPNKFTAKTTLKDKNADKGSNLFRGYLFVLLRTSKPPRWMVDYDSKELDKLIRTHNGQLLSLKLLEALKADSIKQSNNNINDGSSIVRRKCHVICWGGGGAVSDKKNRQGNNLLLQQQFALHPLLSQIQRRNLCELVVVNPNWLQTCMAEQKVVDHTSLPLLFQPQSWPWRKIHTNNNAQDAPETKSQPAPVKDKENDSTEDPIKDNDSNNNSHSIHNPKMSAIPRISVTGFVGYTRAAIVQAIVAMGATFDDSMHQHKTTHLICSERVIAQQQQQPDKKNQKLLKAKEWGIHAVSVDWLYHVLQYGGGKNKKAMGDNDDDNDIGNSDEARFAVHYGES